MMGFRFGTAINCIDGRTPEIVIDYMKQKYNIDGVYMVTFQCAIGFFFVEQDLTENTLIRRAVSTSIKGRFADNSSSRTI